ncbi:E3 ubiquitin-protein ligase chfr, partial [Globisporangium splendens]
MTPPPRSARETSDSNASTPVAEEPLRSVWSFAHAFTIGRSRSSDVVIPTTDKTRTISKAHVRIFPVRDHGSSGSVSTASPHSFSTRRGTATYDRKATRWMLQDLEAMNGTSLNGFDLPLSGCAELHDGDELVLASMMRHGVRIAIHFPYEDSSSIRVKFVEQPATPTPTPERRSSNQLSTNGTVSRLGFETPTSHTSTTPRYSSSTVATKRERYQRGDASERRYSRHSSNNNNNELMENADEEVVRRKRTRCLEELDDQERCMVCPICFEYFHSSVTLPCSHTFCGFCVSNWFRASLSCPQCRTDVKTLPVRNRALDDLVQRLVGEAEAYKTLIAKRMQLQSQSQTSEPQPEPRPQSSASPFRNPFLSDSARTTTPSRTAFSNAVARTGSSAMIYEWEQSLEELNVYIRPPPGITASMILCEITANHVTLGLRGTTDKFLNFCGCRGELLDACFMDCLCTADQGELTINLQKMKKGLMWPSVFVGHGEVQQNSSYLIFISGPVYLTFVAILRFQLDPMAQEATKRQMMLERFQEENPGFDFSGAEFNGSAPDPRTFMGGVKYSKWHLEKFVHRVPSYNAHHVHLSQLDIKVADNASPRDDRSICTCHGEVVSAEFHP